MFGIYLFKEGNGANEYGSRVLTTFNLESFKPPKILLVQVFMHHVCIYSRPCLYIQWTET